MNNSQQIIALILMFVVMAFPIAMSLDDSFEPQPDPRVDRNFHASSGVPVDVTDKPATMKLR